MDETELIAAFKALGHVPKMDEDGEVNWFVLDMDIHNGPGCAVCGESFCQHCIKDADDLFRTVGRCIGPEGVKEREAKYHQERIENAVKLLRSEDFEVKPPKTQ